MEGIEPVTILSLASSSSLLAMAMSGPLDSDLRILFVHMQCNAKLEFGELHLVSYTGSLPLGLAATSTPRQRTEHCVATRSSRRATRTGRWGWGPSRISPGNASRIFLPLGPSSLG